MRLVATINVPIGLVSSVEFAMRLRAVSEFFVRSDRELLLHIRDCVDGRSSLCMVVSVDRRGHRRGAAAAAGRTCRPWRRPDGPRRLSAARVAARPHTDAVCAK